jgi:hypothetical protein
MSAYSTSLDCETQLLHQQQRRSPVHQHDGGFGKQPLYEGWQVGCCSRSVRGVLPADDRGGQDANTAANGEDGDIGEGKAEPLGDLIARQPCCRHPQDVFGGLSGMAASSSSTASQARTTSAGSSAVKSRTTRG